MPYSFSQLSTYQTCPRQFEYATRKKIPRSITAGESFGSSVHNALARFGKLEMANQNAQSTTNDQLALFAGEQEPERHDLTVETLIDLWHQSFIVEGYESKIDADLARRKGETMMHQFFDWWSLQEREVVCIESGFTLQDFNVRGRFDRIEKDREGLHVIDYKTGGVRTQESVDADLQLSIYALAATKEFSAPCSALTLLFLQEDQIIPVTTTRTSEQLKIAQENIDTLAERIESEDFTATPSQAVCNRCPYRGICNSAVKL